MIEDFEVPVRAAWGVYHETVRRLGGVGGLTVHGLDMVRRDLRPGGVWTEDTIPEGFEQQRILLLHDVASLLGEIRGIADYYRGAGDILDVGIPDSPAGLEL